jgi:hypothetical protein
MTMIAKKNIALQFWIVAGLLWEYAGTYNTLDLSSKNVASVLKSKFRQLRRRVSAIFKSILIEWRFVAFPDAMCTATYYAKVLATMSSWKK